MSFNNLEPLTSSMGSMLTSRPQLKALQSHSFVKMPKLVASSEQPIPKHIFLEKKQISVKKNVHKSILSELENKLYLQKMRFLIFKMWAKTFIRATRTRLRKVLKIEKKSLLKSSEKRSCLRSRRNAVKSMPELSN